MNLKLNLTQNIEIKAKFAQLLDAIIEAIVSAQDFFLYRHITVTEAFLFLFSSGRALWFLAFGVQNANYDYYFPDAVWIGYFSAAAVIHLIGFFRRSCRLRKYAATAYTIAYAFLMWLAFAAKTNAPAVPSFAALTLFSFFLIVRISRGKVEC